MTRIAALVLAAGASRRMGSMKLLLPLAGRPLLQHVLDAVAGAALDGIVLVVGAQAAAIEAAVLLPAHCRVVRNPAPEAGQSRSLACGLAALGGDVDAALVLLGDQPGVTSELIERVAAEFRTGATPAVRPVWRDERGAAVPGHPVALARSLWSEVTRLEGDEGARALWRAHPEWMHEVELPGPPLRDVDDRDDYRRAVAAGRA